MAETNIIRLYLLSPGNRMNGNDLDSRVIKAGEMAGRRTIINI